MRSSPGEPPAATRGPPTGTPRAPPPPGGSQGQRGLEAGANGRWAPPSGQHTLQGARGAPLRAHVRSAETLPWGGPLTARLGESRELADGATGPLAATLRNEANIPQFAQCFPFPQFLPFYTILPPTLQTLEKKPSAVYVSPRTCHFCAATECWEKPLGSWSPGPGPLSSSAQRGGREWSDLQEDSVHHRQENEGRAPCKAGVPHAPSYSTLSPNPRARPDGKGPSAPAAPA